jgi:NAD(P)-dependent dehydrogenase (short-subunit alcohol dehydrogenase family)
MAAARSVLITGCSTGIGRATALRLAGSGWTVYATARRVETLAELEAAGCTALPLDVTDEASMEAAVAQVAPPLGALVNNAGYSLSGALETLPLEEVRRQFETNVFGLLRLTQLVLPQMREARNGRIVNLSSMGGRLTFPGGGAYHATKWAVEALSDVLRVEVAPFGIDVVVIEPGLIKSAFGETAAAGVGDGDGTYAAFNASVAKATREVYEGPAARLGGGPEVVAEAIQKALERRKAPTRVPVTPSARILMGLHAVLPDRLWDRAVKSSFDL